MNRTTDYRLSKSIVKLTIKLTLAAFALLAVSTGFMAAANGPEVEIRCTPDSITAFQGEKVVLTIEVKNNSAQSIRPENNYFISYHLHDENEKCIAYDNRRFEIPNVLRRKKTTSFQLPLYFDYGKSGHYVVHLDIVKEGEFWGSGKKWKTAKLKLHLKPLISKEFAEAYLPVFFDTGRKAFNDAQYLLRMTLKNCELTHKGKLFGFAAGSTYPAVWIRDTATVMGYAKHYYPLEALQGSVQLFLQRQGEDGSIVDWVDASGRTDKNTVETDQESSLLLAAFQLAQEDPAWLDKEIGGKSVFQRLQWALEWVWENRRDKKMDLITSGFTADWGDVENTYPDKRARKLSDRSTLVFGIYTQAKYIQAIRCFIGMAGMVKMASAKEKKGVIAKWRHRLRRVKEQTMKYLYLEDKGYFITHVVTSATPKAERKRFFEMEKEMVPVGGNAEAILAGLMNREQVKRFIGVLEACRKTHKLRSVSFTLIPPYPEGFFPHHLLRFPWNYQNGGEWDWFGGRVVNALFRMGFREEGEKYLLEIVNKNLKNFCIFEWEDRRGTGRGALFYVGAAGVIGEALLREYASGGPPGAPTRGAPRGGAPWTPYSPSGVCD